MISSIRSVNDSLHFLTISNANFNTLVAHCNPVNQPTDGTFASIGFQSAYCAPEMWNRWHTE